MVLADALITFDDWDCCGKAFFLAVYDLDYCQAELGHSPANTID
jgi:hypothetical protein